MEEKNKDTMVKSEAGSEPVPTLPGAALREARERQGLSVADVAGQTKLAPRQVEALEADDFAHLPEMAFVRGFVRSYAKILKLDSQPLLSMLPLAITQAMPKGARSSVEAPFPDAHSPRTQNLLWLGAALLLSVVVVAFVVWHYTSPRIENSSETVHPVEMAITLPLDARVISASDAVETEDIAADAVVAEPASPPAEKLVPVSKPEPDVKHAPEIKAAQDTAKPVPATPKAATVKPTIPDVIARTVQAAPVKAASSPSVVSTPPTASASRKTVSDASGPQSSLRLSFTEETWAEVRDANGNVVFSQINPAGSALNLTGAGPLTLVVGHASTSSVVYKGKTIDLSPYIHASSDVARLTLE